MLPLIAWRNVWRSRGRSLVVIAAVVIGIWSLLFAMGFSDSVTHAIIKGSIENQYAHIQLHHPNFKADLDNEYSMANAPAIVQSIKDLEGVQGVSARTLQTGMLYTSRGATGLQIVGINPNQEATVTRLDKKIKVGKYFDDKTKRSKPIIISQRLAEKQRIKIRSKVVLTLQDKNGEIVREAFKVVGLFNTGNSQIDQSKLYVRNSDIIETAGTGDAAHQIAVFLSKPQLADTLRQQISAAHPNILVETWKEVAPDLKFIEDQSRTGLYVFLIIVMLALVFGIINTMLMAVLERTKEIGMLMAVGMTKGKVFSMIVLETLMLTFTGVPIGMLLGWATVTYYGNNGMDLSSYGEALEKFGMDPIIYPSLPADVYLIIGVAVGLTAILGALYPAFKSIGLRPVEAIRSL